MENRREDLRCFRNNGDKKSFERDRLVVMFFYGYMKKKLFTLQVCTEVSRAFV